MEKNKKYTLVKCLIVLAVFVGILVFYLYHPIYVFNSDDWTYISRTRLPIPDWNRWNPTRVLPEVLFPTIAQIGVSFIYPLTGDYIEALAIAFAVFVSILISAYFAEALSLIDKKFNVKAYQWIILFAIFVFYHFLNNGNGDSMVQYVLFGQTLTNTMYYTVSSLVNAILVLWLMKYDSLPKFGLSWKFIVFAIGVYFSINSNMYSSIVLVSYSMSRIVYEFIVYCKANKQNKKLELKSFIREFHMLFVILIVYALSLVFEVMGGRSDSFSSNGLELAETWTFFVKSLRNMIWWMLPLLAVSLISVALLIYNLAKKKEDNIDLEYRKIVAISGMCTFISVAFLILLSAKVTPNYIGKPKVLFAWLFWVLLAAFVSLIYLLKKIKQITVLLPVVALLLCFIIFGGKAEYVSSHENPEMITNEAVRAIGNSIIEEAQKADERGEDSVDIRIPMFTGNGNWPLDTDWGNRRISNTLYKHGLVKRQIEVHLIADRELSEFYNINLSK